MPRPPRDLEAGLFHVYVHSVWASDHLFRDDSDRMTFLRELALATGRVNWTCLCYCLMTTHHHLILDVERGALAKGMHSLSFRYASYFNQRHAMKGHVHGRRYGARRIVDEADLQGAYKYVVRNPEKAGICAPEAWQWSSYPAALGLVEPPTFVDPGFVLRSFDDRLEHARAALRAFVAKP